jgi:hypothetical protein
LHLSEEVLEESTEKLVPTTEIQAPASSEQPRVPETQSIQEPAEKSVPTTEIQVPASSEQPRVPETQSIQEPAEKSVPTTEIQAPVSSEQPSVPETQSTPEVSHGENVPSAVSAPAIVQQQRQQQSSEPRPYEEFMEEAHLTALKIRKDKESEIRNIEEYWRNQLSNLTNEIKQVKSIFQQCNTL